MISFRDIYHKLLLRIKIFKYNLRKSQIQAKIAHKPQIKVVFFVLYDNMWKSDGLFQLLMDDEKFNPYIISSPYPHHPRDFSQANQSRLEMCFKKKGFPYYNGYNFDTNEWFDIKAFKPDIVFYQQPYNTGYDGFKIESLWKDCLFGYVPYTYELEDSSSMVNGLLMNIAWRVFLPSDFEVKKQGSFLYNKGKNLVATGSPLADYICSPINGSEKDFWKQKDISIKKVIWAPHHSILDADFLHYSNFLEIAEGMLSLAESYRGKVQFAFKPHPVLKRKLYKLDSWGKERTDNYYNEWANNPNTSLVEGEYVDLFKTSDAMIHDCSTFTAEYLFTKKPVLFLIKEGQEPNFNAFGIQCLEKHYLGNNIEDVKSFINTIVIEGFDSKQKERIDFFDKVLVPNKDKNTAQTMYESFCRSFK